MKTSKEWVSAIEEYFKNIGSGFEVMADLDTERIFYVSKNGDENNFSTLSRKIITLMQQNANNPQKFDTEMKKLFKNGNVRYYEPATNNLKVLKYEPIDNTLSAKSFIAEEPDHEINGQQITGWFLAWLKFKAVFFESARATLSSMQIFNADITFSDKVLDRERQELNKYIGNKTKVEKSKSVEVDNQLNNRLNKTDKLEQRIMSVLGTTPNNNFFPKEGKYFLDTKAFVTIPSDITGTKLNEKKLAYVGLCTAIGDCDINEGDAYRINESVIKKCLLGIDSADGNELFYKLAKDGRNNVSMLNILGWEKYVPQKSGPEANNEKAQSDLLSEAEDKKRIFTIIGFKLSNGIKMLNQMLNTAHPAELIDPDSGCFEAAKIIYETMQVLNEDSFLKDAAMLSPQDEVLANGAAALYQILQNSKDAQASICSGQVYTPQHGQKIALEAKLRGVCAVNEFARYGVEPLTKLKNTDSNTNLEEKIKLYLDIYDKKAANSIILKLGTSPNYLEDNDTQLTELEKQLANKTTQQMKNILLNGVCKEAEIQSKKALSELNKSPKKKNNEEINYTQEQKKKNQDISYK